MNKGAVRSACSLLVLVCLGLLGTGWSHAAESSGEMGILGGALFPDDGLTLKDGSFDEVEPLVGFRGAYFISDNWSWVFDGTFAEVETLTPGGDSDTFTARVTLEKYFGKLERDRRWFVNFGSGLAHFDFKDALSVDRTIASVGFGQQIATGKLSNIRWELRADRSLDDDGLDGVDLTNFMALVGMNWGRGKAPVDTDGDGVVDPLDDCPGTRPGVPVDESGCPMDRDGDGVFYGIDRCPDTPQGWPVDGVGCPTDSDGDGVPDGADDCPDTPVGAHVDASGCTMDSDGDGVLDGLDHCPDTPPGVSVDPNGCPLDSDGDGVFDGPDRCPDTPAGSRVDRNGCPPPALVLPDINFELDSAELLPRSKEILDSVAGVLAGRPEVRIEIGGHTDSQGSDDYNVDLSGRRAGSVRTYLIEKGVNPASLVARGYGETQPVADNETEEGRARNRRVELKRID